MAHGSLGSMVVRPPGPIDTQALAANETIVLDLTNRQDLRALPDTIGLITSLQILCLAGALGPFMLVSSCTHDRQDSQHDCMLLSSLLRRMRQRRHTAGLGRTALGTCVSWI